MFFKLLFILLFITSNVSAQKQKYWLFSAGEKHSQDYCNEKVVFDNAEIMLSTEEAIGYEGRRKKELYAEYPPSTKHKNFIVRLVEPNQSAIMFSGQRIYSTETMDGYNCTSTFYGIVIAKDVKTAEAMLTALKQQNKRCTYSTMKYWDKSQL